ncbi:MAG: cytochrome c [Sphingomonadaceae bacterium]
MKSAWKVIAFASLGLTACSNPDTPGGRAADARHESFEELGEIAENLQDELKGEQPDAKAIQAAAARLEAMAGELPGWFPAGSGPDDGLYTEALQAVWTQAGAFKTASDNFTNAAQNLNAVAQTGDVAKIRSAAQETLKSCKACHDKFRE